MIYTLDNGRCVSIPIEEIENLEKSLQLSKNEAIEVWLTDNGYEIDEEQAKLDEKASKVFISTGAVPEKSKKERKKPTIKVSDEKKALFDSILTNLTHCEGVELENIKVLNKNKLIEVRINDKIFKIDIVQCRAPKKEA